MGFHARSTCGATTNSSRQSTSCRTVFCPALSTLVCKPSRNAGIRTKCYSPLPCTVWQQFWGDQEEKILHLQRQTHSPKEEGTVLTPQQQIHSLKVKEAGLPSQKLARAYDVGSPEEALASGQSATYLCPAPATTMEFQGAGACPQ